MRALAVAVVCLLFIAFVNGVYVEVENYNDFCSFNVLPNRTQDCIFYLSQGDHNNVQPAYHYQDFSYDEGSTIHFEGILEMDTSSGAYPLFFLTTVDNQYCTPDESVSSSVYAELRYTNPVGVNRWNFNITNTNYLSFRICLTSSVTGKAVYVKGSLFSISQL